MWNFSNIVRSLCAFCLVASLCGCSSDRVQEMEATSNSFYLRLRLSINDNGQTRAATDHPYGGEDGDGTEVNDLDGTHPHEYDIHDLTIYVFNGNSVNNDENTPIKFSQYFNGLSLTGLDSYSPVLEIKDKNYIPDDHDRIIVLANMGNKTGLTKLGEVRDLYVEKAWAREGSTIKDYYYFAMSSALDDEYSDPGINGKVNVSHSGTKSDPFVADATIQRVAARIDFWFIKPLTTGEEYIEYKVGSGTEQDVLRLSHVRIVNASQMQTYNLKRTATGVKTSISGITYLGTENVNTGTHIPTNYVVEPLTHYKNNVSTVSKLMLNTWFGDSDLEHSKSTAFLASNEYKIATHSSEYFTSAETDYNEIDILDESNDDKVSCYTLGYVMENTMDITGQANKFMTGLELKGTYVPHANHIMKLSGGSPVVDTNPYTPGTDFWYYENAGGTIKYIFSNETDANTYKAANSGSTVKRYVNGECYYYVWIRHAMYDGSHGTKTFPMEYGIVRNNIYRIGVQGVEGLGTEVPYPGPELLKSMIYVRDWRLRIHSDIVL